MNKLIIGLFKKIIMLSVFCTLMLFSLCSCGKKTANKDSIKIVCSTFPQYDWVRNLTKDVDNIDLHLLVKNGIDIHNYQPTAEDIMTISDCDIFIYVGGLSDKWLDDVLKQTTNKDMILVDMMDIVKANLKEEEIVEGMEAEEEEEDEEEGVEYDEHIWLSLTNAKMICTEIETALEKTDSPNSAKYKTNLDEYIACLDELDGEYKSVVAAAKKDTILFGDRFPFRYLVDDYQIKYYAAFVGCSAESEASFETIKFLADKLNELKLPAVISLDGSKQDLANTVIENSGMKDVEVITMDSMQTINKEDIDNGKTYIDSMKTNLNALKIALEAK